MKRLKKVFGFTLIELLIVVAIIAILAAIAVPNFLEAQTRAKISRVKADQRSIATALESYRVDNNVMPISFENWQTGVKNAKNVFRSEWPQSPTTPFPSTRNEQELWQYSHLTTPIAYMTSVPKDPFTANNKMSHWSQADHFWYDTMEWVKFDVNNANFPAGFTSVRSHKAYGFGYTWVIASAGPVPFFGLDRLTGVTTLHPIACLAGIHTVVPAYNIDLWHEVDDLYDPTNGTASTGWIMRTDKGITTRGGPSGN